MRLNQTLAAWLFLRLHRRLKSLRGIPLIGGLLHTVSNILLPKAARIWAKIEKGAAEGLWIRINPRFDGALHDGTYEPEVQETLSELLRPGMVFYDLGANSGFYTLIGARCVGSSGKIFAFEPDPELCNDLSENVARNGFSNVELVDAAVCSATGFVAFSRASSTPFACRGTGRIDRDGSESETIRVRTVALDDFIREAPPPDLIKCDVEGGEVDVLEGARSILSLKRPILICEAHSKSLSRAVGRMLQSFGYSVAPIEMPEQDSADEREHLLALPRVMDRQR